MTPAERIAHLVATGAVTPAEGERLLAAMASPPRTRARLDPFPRFGGGPAALVGLATVIAGLALSRLGIRFDGLIDLHVMRAGAPALGKALLDQLLAVGLPVALFYGYARLVARGVRLVDFVGVVGLGRLPVVALALPTWWLAPAITQPIQLTAGVVAVVLVGLTALAGTLALLFLGFRHASGLALGKAAVGFVAVVILAEVLAKLGYLLFT